MADTPFDDPRLRRLGPGDEEAMWALRGLALRESPDAFTTHRTEHPTLEAYRERQAGRWSDAGQSAVGAHLRGRLLGMVSVVREARRATRHRANLYGLYVAPEARGAGLGRALVLAAVAEARRLGADQLELAVTSGNDPALALYESAGFRTWGVQPRALRHDGRDLDEVWMSLALTSAAHSVVTE